MEIISVEKEGKVCVFCRRGIVDELNLGMLFSRDNVTCHYYCLLFTSNLSQNGEWDQEEGIEDGIMGFLLDEILKEVRRVVATKKSKTFYKCKFCKKEGATIGCGVKACKALFHFPCGLENGVNYSFVTDGFEGHCIKHRAKPIVRQVPDGSVCLICLCDFEEDENSTANEYEKAQGYIVGTCCNQKFYHRTCVLKYASNAGSYVFKCPGCNSVDFQSQVERQGVLVPEQDASWEQEPDAFADLMHMGNCEMKTCLCDKGRDYYDQNDGCEWNLVKCENCGSNCTHVKCAAAALKPSAIEKWKCETCRCLQSRKSNAPVLQQSRKKMRCMQS